MKRKWFTVALVFLLVFSFLVSSCSENTTPAATSSSSTSKAVAATSTAASTGSGSSAQSNWWDDLGTPRYGGTITLRVESLQADLDPYSSWGGIYQPFLETLWKANWTVDRNVWAFTTPFIPPEYAAGSLAESWEQVDPLTLNVTIKKGIFWQDKAPVNGRAFTADDVAFHYDRLLGTGHGFSSPSPINGGRLAFIEKVNVIDDYNLQFIFKYPTAVGFIALLDMGAQNVIEAKEWVALGDGAEASGDSGDMHGVVATGPLTDWHNGVGTGPWILSDYVDGTGATYQKNPNYWGYDERFPQNKLPYADTMKISVIPDLSTAIAAIRTGKIDFIDSLPWQQAQTIAKSNPELKQLALPAGGQSIDMITTVEPFNDIRVRQAMQLAIDMKTIAEVRFGGLVNGEPSGMINPVIAAAGYGYPYSVWSQSLKDEYAYDPARAAALLTEAGYPNGFKTNVVAPTSGDSELMQIVKSQLMEIGVDMEIKMMDTMTWMAFCQQRKQDQMDWDPMGKTGATVAVTTSINMFHPSDFSNFGGVNDAYYNSLVDGFNNAATLEEAKDILKQADKYSLEQHWIIALSPGVTFNIWQPYLGGYSGETMSSGGGDYSTRARLWVDQDLKDTLR